MACVAFGEFLYQRNIKIPWNFFPPRSIEVFFIQVHIYHRFYRKYYVFELFKGRNLDCAYGAIDITSSLS